MEPRLNEGLTGYDVIGDVHGEAGKLRQLLSSMGYRETGGVWRHDDRKAVFVGDYIDRGPEQVETYRIIRAMVENGSAHAIMGNHELNAIAYATPDGKGDWCRRHNESNRHGHAAFLEQVKEGSELHIEIIEWFETLPLWLDLGGIKVIHACWDEEAMHEIKPYLDDNNALKPEFIPQAAGIGSSGKCFIRANGNVDEDLHPLYRGIETLLKGVEVELPQGISYYAEGKERHATRVGWWSPKGTSYDDGAIFTRQQRENLKGPLPATPLPTRAIKEQVDDRPIFIGHYWRQASEPAILASNVICVDFSACRGGDLVAYRWSGEAQLMPENIVGQNEESKTHEKTSVAVTAAD